MYMHDLWFIGEMTFKVMKVKLTSSFEIAAEFNTELQHPSESVSFPDQPLFSWFKNLNILQRGLFYVFFLTCTCVVPHVPTHTCVLYICMCSKLTAPGRVPAPAKAVPAHTHTRVSPPTHSLGAVLQICLQTPCFPSPEKGICIWSDSTSAF